MSFDLVELLKFLGVKPAHALWLIPAIIIGWFLFSGGKNAERARKRVIKTFSSASSAIHIDQERLAERIGVDIDEVLTNLQQETDADNVLVVRFRNGSYDSMGSSILKFFASNEKTKSGYPQIGDRIQNISRSLYGNFCDTLIREHKVYIKDKNTFQTNSELMGLYSLFNRPEKFFARSLVTTHDGQIIGFICVVYSTPHRIAESKIDEALIEACSRIVAKIEMGKISVKQKKKK
jgi:hypothetical protein